MAIPTPSTTLMGWFVQAILYFAIYLVLTVIVNIAGALITAVMTNITTFIAWFAAMLWPGAYDPDPTIIRKFTKDALCLIDVICDWNTVAMALAALISATFFAYTYRTILIARSWIPGYSQS